MSDFIQEWVLGDKEQAASDYADAAEKKHSCNPYLTGCCFSETAIEVAFIKGCDWANARAEKKVQGLVEALEDISIGDSLGSFKARRYLAEYRGEK